MVKRLREGQPSVNTQLVEIYEDLAHESPQVRETATRNLVTGFAAPEYQRKVTERLFRGLCSSRKFARPGFSLALTTYLWKGFGGKASSDTSVLLASDVIEIWLKQTTSEGGTSGQDERDHHIGRVFGAGALIESGIVFDTAGSDDMWKSIVELLCDLSRKKPWLRQETGSMLTKVFESQGSKVKFVHAQIVLDTYQDRQLMRTPEGVAICLVVKEQFPSIRMPKDAWKHTDLLHADNSKLLKQALLDSKVSTKDANNGQSQGSGIWSSRLHPVWRLLLPRMWKVVPEDPDEVILNDFDQAEMDMEQNFGSLWHSVIEAGYFDSSSSPERRQTGLLILDYVIAEAPSPALGLVWSPSLISLLTSHVANAKQGDRYLNRVVQKVFKTCTSRAQKHVMASHYLVKGLLKFGRPPDLTNLVKAKIFHQLMQWSTEEWIIEHTLSVIAAEFDADTRSEWSEAELNSYRKVIIDLEADGWIAAIGHKIREQDQLNTMNGKLGRLGEYAFFSTEKKNFAGLKRPVSEQTRQHVQRRLMDIIKADKEPPHQGHTHFVDNSLCVLVTLLLDGFDRGLEPYVKLEGEVDEIFRKAGKIFKKLDRPFHTKVEENGQLTDRYLYGLLTLYGLALFQVLAGETEAVGILDDLNAAYDALLGKAESAKGSNPSSQVDAFVEVILGFTAKPSKSSRTIGLQAFGNLAANLTPTGLEPLKRVIATKESVAGQADMFDAENEDAEEEETTSNERPSDSDEETTLRSDLEMLDSDVELLNGQSQLNDSSDDDVDEADDDEDADIAAKEALLADLLKTQRGRDEAGASSDSENSDTDMDDEEMLALEPKLNEIFQNMRQGQEQSKKKETKDAKEVIVDFKNRVLDMVELLWKQEMHNDLSLHLITPILALIRTTKSKQLADRASKILREFCQRCKGKDLPNLSDEIDQVYLSILNEIGDETGAGASNAHATSCSQATILFAKCWVNANRPINVMIDHYTNVRKRQMSDDQYLVQPGLFVDWNNWCHQYVTSGKLKTRTKAMSKEMINPTIETKQTDEAESTKAPGQKTKEKDQTRPLLQEVTNVAKDAKHGLGKIVHSGRPPKRKRARDVEAAVVSENQGQDDQASQKNKKSKGIAKRSSARTIVDGPAKTR